MKISGLMYDGGKCNDDYDNNNDELHKMYFHC